MPTTTRRRTLRVTAPLVLGAALLLSSCLPSWARELLKFGDAVLDNKVTVMSFNIQHDENDHGAMWAVEWVLREDLEIHSMGSPPTNFMSAGKTVVREEDDIMRIFFFSDRADRVIRSLQVDKPMVIGLQEAFYSQARIIAHALGYARYARGRGDDIDDDETNAILWDPARLELQSDGRILGFPIPAQGTFWYSNTPDEPGSMTDNADWGHPELTRIASFVRLKIRETGHELYVFNTHLQHDGGAGDFKRNRMKSVELLMQRIADRKKPNVPFIVTGDFNDEPTTVPIDLMTRSSVTFDGRTWTNSSPTVDTFKERNTSELSSLCSGTRRIDYVFRSATVMSLDASIMRDPPGAGCPSDHLPVTASVSVPASP